MWNKQELKSHNIKSTGYNWRLCSRARCSTPCRLSSAQNTAWPTFRHEGSSRQFLSSRAANDVIITVSTYNRESMHMVAYLVKYLDISQIRRILVQKGQNEAICSVRTDPRML